MESTKPEDPAQPPTSESPIHALLVRLTKVHRLTQEEIEAAAKVSQARLSRWLRGDVPSNAEAVFRLIELEQRLLAEEEKRIEDEVQRRLEARQETPAPTAG